MENTEPERLPGRGQSSRSRATWGWLIRFTREDERAIKIWMLQNGYNPNVDMQRFGEQIIRGYLASKGLRLGEAGNGTESEKVDVLAG